MTATLRAIAIVALLLIVTQPNVGGTGTPQTDALDFFKNYFVTGDYASNGVSLWRKGIGGKATGNITISGIPSNAEIVSAFLYVQTAEKTQWSGIDHAKFKGYDLGPGELSQAKALNWYDATPTCWTVGWPKRRLVTYRADVLRYLIDTNPTLPGDIPNPNFGKHVANGTHSVQVPDGGSWYNDDDEDHGETGSGPGARALGASLVVVYRAPGLPLRSVVIYDGGFTNLTGGMKQTIKGFYQTASSPAARFTTIVGDGSSHRSEKVLFNGSVIATDPFTGSDGSKWDDRSFNVSMSGNASSATIAVNPYGWTPDCLSFSAVVFSAKVKDTDSDGLLDVWETQSGLVSPDGQPLPNLPAMGALPNRKDLFVELGAMIAAPGTTYGTGAKQEVDAIGHNHLPRPTVLKMVGDALLNAPPGREIKVHFDGGPDYEALYGSDANEYLVPAAYARGGELVVETACVPSATLDCQFPNYPGVVSWKIGFQLYRDAPVADDGSGLSPEGVCPEGLTCTRLRFDRNRHNMFHYVLYAHSRGKPKSTFPCLDEDGKPVGLQGDSCEHEDNPEFRIPSTSSGAGDVPGGNAMITLGAWGDGFVGSDFEQASTTLHELGHNLWLGHGGGIGQPNCNPAYLSVMNYLFQVNGLVDANQDKHLGYSTSTGFPIDETQLFDGLLPSALPFQTAWYAPLLPGTLPFLEGTSAAKKFCDGRKFPDPLPDGWQEMARVDGILFDAVPVDWNGDFMQNAAGTPTAPGVQDVNLDGLLSGGSSALGGFDDWANLSLAQVSSGRNMGGFSLGLDFSGGIDFSGGLDFGGGIDFSGGMIGGIDFSGDLIGGTEAELDVETVIESGAAKPTQFKACILGVNCAGTPPAPFNPLYHRVRLTWNAPAVGTVTQYLVYRTAGTTVTPSSTLVLVGSTTATTIDDLQEHPDGAPFTYFAVAQFDGGTQTSSNRATIIAVNDPPTANADAYTVNAGATLTAAAVGAQGKGVLANDTDVDSATLTALLQSGPAHAAQFTLNADGSFTYKPAAGFVGIDTFSYKAKDVTPLSAANVPATVSIEVKGTTVAYQVTIDPLKTPATQGSAVPIEWKVKTSTGQSVTALSAVVKLESVFNGPKGTSACTPSTTGTRETLFSAPEGATGSSGLRIVSGKYKFNWDTKTTKTNPIITGKGCYTVLIYLDDQPAPRLTTAVQLK